MENQNKLLYKYSVLCYIFNGYEQVREVQEKDPNAEYILVTDDPKLKSKTWKVVYDAKLAKMSVYRRCCNVRYNPFKYISTNLCIYIDGSIQIKKSLHKLVDDFCKSQKDLAICGHPFFCNILQEYTCWVHDKRGRYSADLANRNLKLLASYGYDFSFKSHVQTGFKVFRNIKYIRDLDRLTYSMLEMLGSDEEIERLDQCIYNFVLNKFFRNMNLMVLSPQVYNSQFMQIYEHGTNVPVTCVDYKKLTPCKMWVLGKQEVGYELH